MEFKGVLNTKKVILMKVTSRERPSILLETVKSYIDLAANTTDMVWLFSLDEDDKSVTNEFIDHVFSLIPGICRLAVIGKSTGKIDAINRDINDLHLHWDILLNISDDQRPIVQGYDDMIRRAMPDDLDASLWFTDGQDHINTQEIVGRTYYNRFKYVYHPDFKSLWCDNLSTDLALFLGKSIRSNKKIIRHHHPAWNQQGCFKMDDLYRRNDKFWDQDKATYHRLKNAGLEKLIK